MAIYNDPPNGYSVYQTVKPVTIIRCGEARQFAVNWPDHNLVYSASVWRDGREKKPTEHQPLTHATPLTRR